MLKPSSTYQRRKKLGEAEAMQPHWEPHGPRRHHRVLLHVHPHHQVHLHVHLCHHHHHHHSPHQIAPPRCGCLAPHFFRDTPQSQTSAPPPHPQAAAQVAGSASLQQEVKSVEESNEIMVGDEEEEEPVFVLTEEWAELFAKSEAKRRLAKQQKKKSRK